MPRRASHSPLTIFINGKPVGVLRREPSGAIDFTYDRTWLEWPAALPISLSLPLREDRYVGAPVAAVIDNMLPDGDAIRRQIAGRVKAEGADAFSLLSAIGRDCVGAMQFLPGDEAPGSPGVIEAVPASDADVAGILADLAHAPLGMTEDGAFRLSLAGAQEKTALLYRDGGWWVPTGSTPTTHILKPAIGIVGDGVDFSDSVDNEYLCMRLTAAFGLPTARVQRAEFAGHPVLVVERFDRRWTPDARLLRLPQEDFCQATSTPSALKYESDGGPGLVRLLRLLGGADDPASDQRALLKANIVFWLLGATDGHAKNFSVFLRPGGRFGLTPLYDVLSAQRVVDAGQLRQNRFRLSMALGRNRHYAIDAIQPRHFVETAKLASIGASIVESVLAELVDEVPDALDRTLATLPAGFPEALAAAIRTGVLRRLPKN